MQKQLVIDFFIKFGAKLQKVAQFYHLPKKGGKGGKRGKKKKEKSWEKMKNGTTWKKKGYLFGSQTSDSEVEKGNGTRKNTHFLQVQNKTRNKMWS